MVREMEKCMGKNEIVGYEPLVDDLKDLIHKKQYQVLKLIISETINLYWEIGEDQKGELHDEFIVDQK